MKRIIQSGAVLMLAAVLSACATKSDVKADGTTDNPVFPEARHISPSFAKKMGTFPTADELAQIKAGMTKDQFYKLLGRPHFNEGMFAVREWDYVFHFHTPGQGTNDVTTCQFKIIYDTDKFARSFHWKAVDPVDAVCPPSQPTPTTQRVSIEDDALFAFDKSGTADMNAAGKAKLDEFANKVKQFDKLNAIRIVGYTDRLGKEDYNQSLSERRAETVRNYLVNRGVPAGVISAEGRGERNPVQQCSDNLSRQALIDCLQPNRRVDIEVDGSGKL